MNPNRFFFPNYMGMNYNMVPTNPMMRLTNNVLRNQISNAASSSGIFHNSSFFNKLTGGIRSINWSGLLNNANKTLNVVNQTIPLVRQAGPMVNNMKNMMKIAKIFGNETSNNIKTNSKTINNHVNNNINPNLIMDENINTNNDVYASNPNVLTQKKEIQNDNSPSFFIY